MYVYHNMQTPLMIAAKNGHLECVKLLISYGADLKRSTSHRHLLSIKSHWGVIQLAEKGGHPQVASYVQQCLQDQKTLNTTRAHLERSKSLATYHFRLYRMKCTLYPGCMTLATSAI